MGGGGGRASENYNDRVLNTGTPRNPHLPVRSHQPYISLPSFLADLKGLGLRPRGPKDSPPRFSSIIGTLSQPSGVAPEERRREEELRQEEEPIDKVLFGVFGFRTSGI